MKAKFKVLDLKNLIKLSGGASKTRALLDPVKARIGKSGTFNVAVSDEAVTLACVVKAKGVLEADEDFEVVYSPKLLLRVLDDYLKFSEDVELKVEDTKLVLEGKEGRYEEGLIAQDVREVYDVMTDDYLRPNIEAEKFAVFAVDTADFKNLGTGDTVVIAATKIGLKLEVPVGTGKVVKNITANIIEKPRKDITIRYVLDKQALKQIMSVLSGTAYIVLMHSNGEPAPITVGQDKEKIKVAYWLVPMES